MPGAFFVPGNVSCEETGGLEFSGGLTIAQAGQVSGAATVEVSGRPRALDTGVGVRRVGRGILLGVLKCAAGWKW